MPKSLCYHELSIMCHHWCCHCRCEKKKLNRKKLEPGPDCLWWHFGDPAQSAAAQLRYWYNVLEISFRMYVLCNLSPNKICKMTNDAKCVNHSDGHVCLMCTKCTNKTILNFRLNLLC